MPLLRKLAFSAVHQIMSCFAGQRALLNAACQSGSGKCTWRWQCDGTRVSDQCLGGPLVTCCVKPDIEYIGQPCDNDQGTCQLSSGCQGVEVPGACPGSSAISCCVPAGALHFNYPTCTHAAEQC